MPIIGEYVTAENIKDILHVGDEVIINDKGRFTVTYTYWNNEGTPHDPDDLDLWTEEDSHDLGFEIDDEDFEVGFICESEIRSGLFCIEKMTD